jgi:hypothetical protein
MLDESPKKEKLADQIRETEQKLKAATEKYHTMNERLSVCMHECVYVCMLSGMYVQRPKSTTP